MHERKMDRQESIEAIQDAIEALGRRGFIGQATDLRLLAELCKEQSITFYVGFDPTAESLHIGSLKQIMMMAHMQRMGHKPIAVVGGGTGMIGDPSGKTVERKLLSIDDIDKNLLGIKAQLERFLDFESGENSALILNNADWLADFTFIDFLRDVGKCFRLGEMLGKESVRMRLQSDEGMSFTEFCYMLLQAYDFLYLFDNYNCKLQMGGSDQWGNITAGMDLVRKLRSKTVYGLTSPLVVTAGGQKFGKTEAGTVWLKPEWTSPYELFQYFVRAHDDDAVDWLKVFTFLPLDEIAKLEQAMKARPEEREAQRRLAWEITALVHGRDEADKAARASEMLFGEEIKDLSDRDLETIFADVPGAQVERSRLEQGVLIPDLLVETGLVKSKREARNLVQQGGVYLNNVRVDSERKTVTSGGLASESLLVLRTGKKKYMLVKAV